MKYNTFLLLLVTSAVFSASASVNDCPPDAAVYKTQSKILQLSDVSVDKQMTYQAQLGVLDNTNEFHFQLTDLKQLNNQTSRSSFQSGNQMLTLGSVCIVSDNLAQPGFQAQLQAIPNSSPMRFMLKKASNPDGSDSFNWAIEQNKGALFLSDREAFDKLAMSSHVSGAIGVRELKFVIVDLDSNNPVLFFMNSVSTPLHYEFVRNVLQRYQDVSFSRGNAQFIADTYFRENRNHVVGSIVAYDHYKKNGDNQENGLYTVEFWPTDPVPSHLIERTYHSISKAMPFLPAPLAYHPVGSTQEQYLTEFEDQFAAKNIRIIHTDDLFENLDSAILNKGEAYGRLKIINQADHTPGEDIIAIYTFIPNSLGHVGGIITEQPQTQLSHINLKARQNNTPNAYIKNVSTDPDMLPLIDNWVHYLVTDDGVQIEAATEAEALKWLADKIPTKVTLPESDLSLTLPAPLSQLGHHDWIRVGVKAANVAELGKILAEGISPQGYAIPFAMYDAFMKLPRCKDDLTKLCQNAESQSFNQYIEQLQGNDEFNQNQQVRKQQLAKLRDLIEKADAPQDLIENIETVRQFWEPEGEPFKQKLRVRSSTNNEDLQGFNGAGLYDSFTHKPKEGKLINSIKQVWASLWNFRAFEERRLHRIGHLKTYMGVLIHPNYGDEQANGVAVTKNIYNPDWEGFYINAQYGELSITNPEPVSTDTGVITPIPDEFIMTRLPASTNGFAWETLFIRHSNIESVYDAPVTTENVLSSQERVDLRNNLQIIHKHFKDLYQGDNDFAMDIEFKITETKDGSRGRLAIKQARPWVD